MILPLLAFSLADTWAHFVHALPVIFGLILIEGLLSVDNALAIAAMANHLDEKKRRTAMNIGYIGAYGFRVLALIFASYIVKIESVMYLGAAYLIWLMCAHFAKHESGQGDGENGAARIAKASFASTVTQIALMDLSLSVDNVVAAIALSPNEMWPVYVGVTIGIIALRLIAGVATKLIVKYPVLEHTAFILIGYVGAFLLLEKSCHDWFAQFSPTQLKIFKFGGILLIVALSMLWSSRPALQVATQPFLKIVRLPMRGFVALIVAVFGVLMWPLRPLKRLGKKA
jgi:tellurite resistance protein TerC